MQNNNKPNGFRRFIRDNGYYFVIGLCVLTIGASAYFLLRDSGTQDAEDVSLNVPVTIEAGESGSTKQNETKQTEDAVATTSPAEEASEETIAEFPPDDTAEMAGDWDAVESVPTSRTVVAPISGETLADYSVTELAYNETTRDWRTHSGIDLAAEQGASVAAAEAGTVSAVYEDDYLGTTVEITHTSGYTTIYSNLESEPCVSVGQSVRAGESIGTVGTSALLEIGQPTHLHFAVMKDDAYVDPLEYLS